MTSCLIFEDPFLPNEDKIHTKPPPSILDSVSCMSISNVFPCLLFELGLYQCE